ncbi:hypothetical protein TrVE_jg4674 [Triparma verrucosa]|uniref:FAD-binding domain-containing protein n=1 Tax=Triparma verrucosa TaxID=1606542 RepID=A0A9W7BHY9_9STRA|nr:hypothetical protein TrVE_jg4674 [Triparma verrucosa]
MRTPLLILLVSISSIIPAATYLPSNPSQTKALLNFKTGTTSTQQTQLNACPPPKSIAVIGAGPAGVASAISLSKAYPSSSITLIDESADPAHYDPLRSYLYLVDFRGQTFINKHLDSSAVKLDDISVAQTDFVLQVLETNSPKPPVSLPIINTNRKTPFWVQRGHLVKLLSNSLPDSVTRCYGNKVSRCEYVAQSDSYVITVSPTSDDFSFLHENEMEKFEADLVIAADGINSFIRENLFDQPTITSRKSPAGKLRFKALQINSNFTAYDDADATPTLQSDPISAYAIRSTKKAYDTKLGMGILPIRTSASALLGLESSSTRPANIITRDDHFIHSESAADATELQRFLEESFPQLAFSGKNSVVAEDELSRFSKSPGTVFPHPQHAKKLIQNSSPNAGIVLVGDSAHAFPPDIGQGVNAALFDVVELEKTLTDPRHQNLASALSNYEKIRLPETKALIKLCATSNPFQYKQTGIISSLRQKLWTANFVLRLLLSKIFGKLFSPNSFYALQGEFSYVKIMSRCDRTTALLYLPVFALLLTRKIIKQLI